MFKLSPAKPGSTSTARRCVAGLVAGVLVLCAAAGCDQSPPLDESVAHQPADPHESFEKIVERFKRRYAGGAVSLGPDASFGSYIEEDGGVTYQIHKGLDAAQPYTAEMTVCTKTYFAAFSPPPADQVEQAAEEAELDESRNPLLRHDPLAEEMEREQRQGPQAVEGIEASDPFDQDQLATYMREFRTTYDFAFENGRWELKTRNLSESAEMAFDYALKYQ